RSDLHEYDVAAVARRDASVGCDERYVALPLRPHAADDLVGPDAHDPRRIAAGWPNEHVSTDGIDPKLSRLPWEIDGRRDALLNRVDDFHFLRRVGDDVDPIATRCRGEIGRIAVDRNATPFAQRPCLDRRERLAVLNEVDAVAEWRRSSRRGLGKVDGVD